jgi:hypothetical protein
MYAVEMGLNAVMYTLNFMRIGSGIQKFLRGIHTQTAK